MFAYGGIHVLRDAVISGQGSRIPHPEWIAIDSTVLGFTILVALATGILFGFAPALQISRSALFESLKEGSRGSTAGRHNQLARSVLVVSEVAFSLMLLVGAGLLVRSFALMLAEPLGFDPENLLTAQMLLPDAHYPDGPAHLEFLSGCGRTGECDSRRNLRKRRQFFALDPLECFLRFRYCRPRDSAVR